MTFELDHIFVLTSAGAGEAERLVASGLVEGTANVHPGQGTACRRFFSTTPMGVVSFQVGSEYVLEVGFDGELRAQQVDFRPALPLIFRW